MILLKTGIRASKLTFLAKIKPFHRAVHSQTACCSASTKKSVVFLGTPQVATIVLKGLLEGAACDSAAYEIAAVVSQPAKPRGRQRNKGPPPPTPVHQLALDFGVPESDILTPASARDEAFLQRLEALKPDLCVTAAYGNMLPQRFLDIPAAGTLNVHPSLLPRYRGAAPVNRCLENGDAVTGVSVAYTVLACDAGPVLAQEEVALEGHEQAPEVLEALFETGTALLLRTLPDVWSGAAEGLAWPQDAAAVTHAAKMAPTDALLDFSLPARTLHNKVRGFAGWPGTKCSFRITQDGKGDVVTEIKVLETRVGAGTGSGDAEVVVGKDALVVSCGDGSTLEVLRLQPVGKKPTDAKSFRNGLQGKRVFIESS